MPPASPRRPVAAPDRGDVGRRVHVVRNGRLLHLERGYGDAIYRQHAGRVARAGRGGSVGLAVGAVLVAQAAVAEGGALAALFGDGTLDDGGDVVVVFWNVRLRNAIYFCIS